MKTKSIPSDSILKSQVDGSLPVMSPPRREESNPHFAEQRIQSSQNTSRLSTNGKLKRLQSKVRSMEGKMDVIQQNQDKQQQTIDLLLQRFDQVI